MTISITKDETIRTIEVYDPDADELSERKAESVARLRLCGNALYWTFLDCEHVNYNRVKVRFQRL